MPFLFILFVVVPVIEIALFIEVGSWIGLGPTLALVVATAVLGTVLIRRQGLDILRRAERTAAAGEAPVAELFHGICVAVGGVLLLTPGFFTDALGLALLIPGLRDALGRRLWRLIASRGVVVHGSTGRHWGAGPGGGRDHPRAGPPDVIDGEYEDLDAAGDTRPDGRRDDDDASQPSRWGRR